MSAYLVEHRLCPDCAGIHTGGEQRTRPCERPGYRAPRLCARRGCGFRLDPLHHTRGTHPDCDPTPDGHPPSTAPGESTWP